MKVYSRISLPLLVDARKRRPLVESSKFQSLFILSRGRVSVVVTVFQAFVKNFVTGGLMLLLTTIVALALTNSPFAGEYEQILHTPIGLSIGSLHVQATLIHWINDGLMTFFFLLVGLEIKREFTVGLLSSKRAALLPIVAAFGGAIVPAILYTIFTFGSPGNQGWGIPMATDIAFVVGVLALLKTRIPLGIKVLLTALAIVDDLIAVVVVAVFYATAINFMALGFGIGFFILLFIINKVEVGRPSICIPLGILVWLAFFESGVHASIAGVLIAWTVPVHSRLNQAQFLARVNALLDQKVEDLHLQAMPERQTRDQITSTLITLCRHRCSPLEALEHRLSPWVAFVIVPLFALANAGVPLNFGTLDGELSLITGSVIGGLVLGKPLGLLAASWLAVWTGIATLPNDVHWRHMVGAGFLAGIGFTMSLLVAALAFAPGPMLDAAKLGIFSASVIAGVLGALVLYTMGTSES